MAAIFQTTFSNAFFWMKICKFRLRFHWNCFPKGPINNIPILVQIMAWNQPGDKPLSEPMTFSLLTHVCVTRAQRVKMMIQSVTHFTFHNFVLSAVVAFAKFGTPGVVKLKPTVKEYSIMSSWTVCDMSLLTIAHKAWKYPNFTKKLWPVQSPVNDLACEKWEWFTEYRLMWIRFCCVSLPFAYIFGF